MAIRFECVNCILLVLYCIQGCQTDCCRCSLSDCQGYKDLGYNTSAVYGVVPLGMHSEMNVYCDLVEDGGGWIVIQRRINISLDFHRGWNSYEDGFGDFAHEFWIGLLPLWRLLVQGHYQLLINIEYMDGETKYAQYNYFMIDNPADKYRLHVHNYLGTAGDQLSDLNGQEFSTKKNNGVKECADDHQGGWWYGRYRTCGPSINDITPRWEADQSPSNVIGAISPHLKPVVGLKSTEIKIKRI